MLRVLGLGFLLLIASARAIASNEVDPSPGDVVQFMADGTGPRVLRDSGQPVTLDFLMSCKQDVAPYYAKLECRDLVPIWHISKIPGAGGRHVFTLTAERPSSEGR